MSGGLGVWIGSGVPESVVSNTGISLILLLLFVLIVKGLALYKAARLKEKVWFWVLLIVNTVGILPLIYLYLRRNKKV